MKTFLKNMGIIAGMLGIFACAQFVIAASFVPGPITPSSATQQPLLPSAFIDQSATAQVKKGKLKIGATGDPTTTLDIAGTAQVISFISTSNTIVAGKLYLGNPINPARNRAANDPALYIESGNIKSTILITNPAATTTKPLCADTVGKIILCP